MIEEEKRYFNTPGDEVMLKSLRKVEQKVIGKSSERDYEGFNSL